MPVDFVPAVAYTSGVVMWAVVLRRAIPLWVHGAVVAVGMGVLAWVGPWWWPGVSFLIAAALGVGLVLTAGRHLSRLGLLSLVVTVAVSSLAGLIATAVALLGGGVVALGVLLRQRGAARAMLDVQDMAAAVGVTPGGLSAPQPERLEHAVVGPRRVRLPVLLLVGQLCGLLTVVVVS